MKKEFMRFQSLIYRLFGKNRESKNDSSRNVKADNLSASVEQILSEVLLLKSLLGEKLEQINEALQKIPSIEGNDSSMELVEAATEVAPDGRFRYVRDAAEYFNVSEYSIRRWIKQGQLKAVKPGKFLIVDVNSLNKEWKTEEVNSFRNK